MADRETVVMITTSYPRFAGDTIATFMEPIARGLAARGHRIHLVLPWHPKLRREPIEGGVHFHPFRYAPAAALNVFGYARALRADVRLRASAWAIAPVAIAVGIGAARRVISRERASMVHGHWVIPGGAIAAAVAGSLPLVVSLHGSDVYVAERHAVAGFVARRVFRRAGWVTACSDDLRERAIALGASAARSETVPYGVDADRFRPDSEARARCRAALGVGDDDPVLFTAGRFVRKKGFEDLLDATAVLASAWPSLVCVIGGGGDLDPELRARAASLGLGAHVRFVGVLAHDEVADHLRAADIAVVPSVRDSAGNVDGLPNIVMEALASATPLVATAIGGIPAVVRSGETAVLVPQHDSRSLAQAIDHLLRSPEERRQMGAAARDEVLRLRSWDRTVDRFEVAYEEARRARGHRALSADRP